MNKKIFIAGILAVALFLTWILMTRVNPQDMVLYQVYIQAVDSETKQSIGVTIERSGDSSEYPPILIEANPTGMVRASWVGKKDSTGSLILSAEGYEVTRVPLELRSVVSSYTARGGFVSPDILELKAQQGGAVQPATSSQLESSGSENPNPESETRPQ